MGKFRNNITSNIEECSSKLMPPMMLSQHIAANKKSPVNPKMLFNLMPKTAPIAPPNIDIAITIPDITDGLLVDKLIKVGIK
jgi:hypothetical protein